jgi:very-short-patch-repair endonuclease
VENPDPSVHLLHAERMDLIPWLAERGGVAHTSDLYEAGISKRAIAADERDGRVARLRRSWIVLPGSEPARIRAASIGGRVTCVTQAAALKLWTPSDPSTHIAVAPNASRLERDGISLHWGSAPAPVAAHTVVDPLINVLFHVARCQTAANALAIWESAIRQQQIALEVLRSVNWRSASARRLLVAASVLSDSGLETHFVGLMRSIGVAVRQQVVIDGRAVDALIGERLVVQLDGFEFHSKAKDRRRDLRADARLVLRGYTVLRFDYAQIMFEPEYVQEMVRTAIAQGRHLARR